MKFNHKTFCLIVIYLLWLPGFYSEARDLISETQQTRMEDEDPPASALASGEWYKFPVEKRGIYKITISELQQAGINTAAIDPRKIRIHGYGNGMLPQANNVERPRDLPEISIFVNGESDGKFDPGDYILFYAEGPDYVGFDEISNRIIVNK